MFWEIMKIIILSLLMTGVVSFIFYIIFAPSFKKEDYNDKNRQEETGEKEQ